ASIAYASSVLKLAQENPVAASDIQDVKSVSATSQARGNALEPEEIHAALRLGISAQVFVVIMQIRLKNLFIGRIHVDKTTLAAFKQAIVSGLAFLFSITSADWTRL
ncbi:MAG: hypothetical protein QNJ04_14990, partial [Desulfobacterales bacterium]|nr:hypothetical protein [Desulfobacterales bacterium]